MSFCLPHRHLDLSNNDLICIPLSLSQDDLENYLSDCGSECDYNFDDDDNLCGDWSVKHPQDCDGDDLNVCCTFFGDAPGELKRIGNCIEVDAPLDLSNKGITSFEGGVFAGMENLE
jgi:hypothetical protein